MATKVKLIADGVITPDQITLTTASTGTNTTAPATTAFVQQEISALVDSSPEALNTLNELAAALGDDANFSTTVTNSIATKAPLASPTFTGTLTASGLAYPTSDGTNGQVLTTDGAGTLSFSTVSGTTINNNADNRIITGSGTANTLNGESGLTYDGSTLAVTGAATMDGLTVDGGATSPTHLFTGSRSGTLVSIDNQSASTSNGLLLNITSLSANSYPLWVRSNDTNRLIVKGNGDISFYDDTGSTQALFWDASAESLGIGTTSPDRLLEVSHDLNAHTPVLRLTGTSASAYAAGLEWYTGYGPKQTTTMYSTASGSQGAEFWMEHRNQDSNTLKRVWHISNTARHTFHGQHNGDSTGHFLFTNSLYDATSTNCTLAVQNGGTFIQIMGWTTLGARIGTRTGGWNSNSGGDVYLTRNDATSIKLASSGPQLSNGTAISSDERLKENITNISDGQLAKINALTPRNFTWKDPRKTGTHEGFIAQEVEAVIPEAVYEDNWAPDPDDDSRDFEGDIKLIRHEVINARLIKAVQELSAKLEAAEARITTLEG